MTETKSPFKFLDYYDSEDTQIFFGREDEEKIMYQLVKKNRFVLIYGPSGSGKTSLVQCGLTRQFEAHEWIPVYVRRGNNINFSLLNELKEKFKIPISPGVTERDQLKYIVSEIRKSDLRPIYLIFDQFEELLILGTSHEKEIFKGLLHEVIEQHSVLSCNVILLLQEEYFAWLDSFEKDLRGISDNRLRVEPMRRDDVKEVIQKSCDHFKISIENPEADINHIIEVLSGKNFISLPYLQVYLDQLWKHAEKKQTFAPRNNGLPHLKFTSSDIRVFGNFKDVLFRFLKQRSEEIQHELSMQFRAVDDDCVFNILDCFVTIEGTKLPIPYTLSNGVYTLDEKAPKYLKELKPPVLKFVLEKLLESRILRADGTNLELAHDTLSKLIDSQRNSMSRRDNEIRIEVQKGFEEWKKDPKEFLSYKKVKEFESFIPTMKLDKNQLDFYNRSKAFREDEELEKLKSVKKFNRLKFIISLLVFILITILIVGNHLMNRANSDFALIKMAYDIDPTTDKLTALKLAKYIYDYKHYNTGDAQNLQTKIVRIALDQSIQALFAANPPKTLRNKVFSAGESDISSDGKYVFVKDDSIKIFSEGKLVTAISDINYGYFLNKPNLLLLASFSSEKSTLGKMLANFSNRFVVYDCAKRKNVDTVDLSFKDGYLYNPNIVFGEHDRSNYSYRVTVTKDGNLIIPFLQYISGTVMGSQIGKSFMAKKVTFKEPERKVLLDVIPSDHPVSYSEHADRLISFEGPYSMGSLNRRTDMGITVDTIMNVQFGSFTDKGNIIFIRDGRVFLRSRTTITSVFIDKGIDAAYSSGEDRYVVASSKSDQFYIADLSSGKAPATKGELVGTDFKTNRIVFMKPKRKNAFFLQSFSGKLVDSFICSKDIESFIYNSDSNCILALTKKDDTTTYQHLYVLDRSLKVRAAFGLTPNDTYGISKDGSTFYYLRDNFLTVFKNNGSLVNLLTFDELDKWMNKKIACPPISRDTLVKYNLLFPKQRITRIFGLHDSKECED